MEKVLVANRGEIAVRVLRSCRDLGIKTVAVYSEADVDALHVQYADEAVCIGKAPVTQSYLKISQLLAACEATGADAIHPGYGFLSESAAFAAICKENNITFIGPSSETIALLGDKAQAKKTAKRAGCPTIPGSEGVVSSVKEGREIAKQFGYPIFIKAVAGGGGKGIRIVYSEEEFDHLYLAARAEAGASFCCDDVYLEKMIEDPRHVEIQIVGDMHGNYIHLGERDCSSQRRRQKLIEECPCPVLSPELRQTMGAAALQIAREAGYYSVGTVEFLLDKHNQFYFMEVNTRIQVEHTITEEWTGIDLVALQLLIAEGKVLPYTQKDVAFHGHVMQFRVNAEDPYNDFKPSPGKIHTYIAPGGPHVRIDSACYAGATISPYYDSMIAKVIVKGKDRAECMQRSRRALSEFCISGVQTTVPLHMKLLEYDPFVKGNVTIGYVDEMLKGSS